MLVGVQLPLRTVAGSKGIAENSGSISSSTFLLSSFFLIYDVMSAYKIMCACSSFDRNLTYIIQTNKLPFMFDGSKLGVNIGEF